MGRLFGTDGIRGQANRYPMDACTAFAAAQAMTSLLRGASHDIRVAVARDTRLSGQMLESAVQAGIASMGGTPFAVGVLPTPGLAFITRSLRADAGVSITASHNPFQDNGIKIFSAAGRKLSDEQEEAMEELMLSGALPGMVAAPSQMGGVRRSHDAAGRYIVFLKNSLPRSTSLEGLKIVLDTANGATYEVAPAAFAELGADVTVIHDKPDGLNINENCGSEHTADLRGAVVAGGAAIGLAFDGDGDRLVAVDEQGNQLTGDQILIICGKWLSEHGRLKNNLIVSTIMSNMGFGVACRRYGFETYAAKVGDRHVLEEMLRLGAVLGGEESGHVIFLDRHTTGDGLLTGLQLIAAMRDAGEPLSELGKLMEVFPQKLINVDVSSKPAIESVPQIVEAIRQVEAELKAEGRVLVRYSGTQSMCRVMVEGPSRETTEKYAADIAAAVKAAIG